MISWGGIWGDWGGICPPAYMLKKALGPGSVAPVVNVAGVVDEGELLLTLPTLRPVKNGIFGGISWLS